MGVGGGLRAGVPRRRDGTDPSGRHFHLRVKLFVSELLLVVHTSIMATYNYPPRTRSGAQLGVSQAVASPLSVCFCFTESSFEAVEQSFGVYMNPNPVGTRGVINFVRKH